MATSDERGVNRCRVAIVGRPGWASTSLFDKILEESNPVLFAGDDVLE